MKTKNLILLAFMILFFSCDTSEEDPEILPPAPATLIFPANNTSCNEGVVIDESRSTVTFEWETAENTELYTLILQDLESRTLHEEQTSENELPVLVERGKTFKWYVESSSTNSAEKSTSEVWSFYNAGEGITSHVPFPAELISPSHGESVTTTTNIVKLEWAGSDLDNDILEYEVYFGKSNPPTHLEKVTSEESFEVNVNSGESYFWFIKTIDQNNNSSNSIVSQLLVN